jgi:acyl-CoA synthetase (AMP-forming)/AMP-acid ligase II
MSRWSSTYGDLLERNGTLFRNLPALSYKDRSITHGELYARALALAGGLGNMGVQPGDRLALLSENRTEVMELLGAAAWLGACLVPINYRGTVDEIRYVLDDVAPRVFFVSKKYAHLVEQLPSGVVQLILDDRADALEGLYRRVSALVPRAYDDQVPLVVMHTAATDGKPKGAVLSHRGLVSQQCRCRPSGDFRLTIAGSAFCHCFTSPASAWAWRSRRRVVHCSSKTISMPTGWRLWRITMAAP